MLLHEVIRRDDLKLVYYHLNKVRCGILCKIALIFSVKSSRNRKKAKRLSYHSYKPTDSQRERHFRNLFAFENWPDLSVIIIKEICSNLVFP